MLKDHKIQHDEYRLKVVKKLKDKLRPIIAEKKKSFMSNMQQKLDLTMNEFELCCFSVTALCKMEDFLDSPWAFLEMYEQGCYFIQIEDLEMMLSDSLFNPISNYLLFCLDNKEILPIGDELFRDELINALDMVVYKNSLQEKD